METMECFTCKGEKRVLSLRGTKKCPTCKAKGYIVTYRPRGQMMEFWRAWMPDYPADLEIQIEPINRGWNPPKQSIWDDPSCPSALMYRYVTDDESGPTEYLEHNDAWNAMAVSDNF